MRQKIPPILVTGGAGFIGSEFVRQTVAKGYRPIIVDKLTYAGDIKRLNDVKGKFTFYKSDICNPKNLENIFKKAKPKFVFHFAAETHVDRSIQAADDFLKTNILGTQKLIDLSRKYKIKKFFHISTDEVYGESRQGQFSEQSPLKPNNPYSASKAGAEMLVKAAIRTFNFPAIIISPANNYGPWQYPEKFVPVIILKALSGQKVPVYGKGEHIREWLHVADCANGIFTIFKKGKLGEVYNIGSYYEKCNLVTAKTILKLLKKNASLIQFVKDRPGHDFRYSVNCTKLRRLGWRPQINYQTGIKQTVDWYVQHISWAKGKVRFLKSYWKKIYKTRGVS